MLKSSPLLLVLLSILYPQELYDPYTVHSINIEFYYAGKLTETMLLGCIAIRIADKYTTLQWDGPNMRFTNLDMANRYIEKKYRKGWSL